MPQGSIVVVLGVRGSSPLAHPTERAGQTAELNPASAAHRRRCPILGSGPRPLAFDATHRLGGGAADRLGVAIGGVVTRPGKLRATPLTRRARMAKFMLIKISFMAEITDADALREAALKKFDAADTMSDD